MEFPQKTKNSCQIQQSYSWAYIWTKLQFEKIHTPFMFIARTVIVAKTWKQPLTDE